MSDLRKQGLPVRIASFAGIGQLLLASCAPRPSSAALEPVPVARLMILVLLSGLVFSALALAVIDRFAFKGMMVLWIAASIIPTLAIRMTMSVFLVPALFFTVQTGLVLLYLWRAIQKTGTNLKTINLSVVVFLVATIPAALVAMIPEAVRFFS